MKMSGEERSNQSFVFLLSGCIDEIEKKLFLGKRVRCRIRMTVRGELRCSARYGAKKTCYDDRLACSIFLLALLWVRGLALMLLLTSLSFSLFSRERLGLSARSKYQFDLPQQLHDESLSGLPLPSSESPGLFISYLVHAMYPIFNPRTRNHCLTFHPHNKNHHPFDVSSIRTTK
jgi:hypothetical protein